MVEMKYCNYCGFTIPDRKKICSNCKQDTRTYQPQENREFRDLQKPNHKLNQSSYYTPDNYLQKKIPFFGFLISLFFFAGGGQLYAGKKQRGWTIIAIFIFIVLTAIIVPLTTNFYYTIYFLNPIIAFFLVWSAIDAFRQVKKYNNFITIRGRKPYPSEIW